MEFQTKKKARDVKVRRPYKRFLIDDIYEVDEAENDDFLAPVPAKEGK
jgi:hypothetical protein